MDIIKNILLSIIFLLLLVSIFSLGDKNDQGFGPLAALNPNYVMHDHTLQCMVVWLKDGLFCCQNNLKNIAISSTLDERLLTPLDY